MRAEVERELKVWGAVASTMLTAITIKCCPTAERHQPHGAYALQHCNSHTLCCISIASSIICMS